MKLLTTLLFISFLTLSCITVSQTNLLNGPEGIAYHSPTKSYFITNATDGKVIKIDSTMEQSVFYEGFSVPMGCEIVGDSLFVASNDPSTVSCLDIYTGDIIESITITQSPSMAHMDIDKRTGFLYVIGQAGQVFKINTKTLTYDLFASVGIPNSSQTCSVDTINNCMYIFSWPTTFVRSVNLLDSTDVQSLINPGFGQNIDCTKDNDGNIYVSSWQGNKINKFAPGCNTAPEVFETGFNKPAGLIYNQDDNLIAVCNYAGNSVDFVELETTGIEYGFADNVDISVYPNPVGDLMNISVNNDSGRKKTVIIYNINGAVLRTAHFTNSFKHLDIKHLSEGMYFVQVKYNKGLYVKKIIKE